MEVRFILSGEPRGKGRPRFTRQGRVFTDAKTVAYERAVLASAKVVLAGSPPLDGPVFLRVDAFMQIPKSASKRRRADMLAGVERPTKTPDWDNLGKIVCDALNGVAFRDDSQVVDGRARKFWSDRPRIEVFFGPIDGGDHDPAASDNPRDAEVSGTG